MESDEQAIQRAVAKRERKALNRRIFAHFHNRSTNDAKSDPDVAVDCGASDAPDAGETQAAVPHVQAVSD